MDCSRSGNCPDAWSCLAYESRSVLGATICLICTPGTACSARAIEDFQNAGVSDGVLKVMYVSADPPPELPPEVEEEHPASSSRPAAATTAPLRLRMAVPFGRGLCGGAQGAVDTRHPFSGALSGCG